MRTVSKHDVPCKRADCVLPECVNLKLKEMRSNTRHKPKKPGRKQKRTKNSNSSKSKNRCRSPKPSRGNQSTEVNVVEAQEGAGHPWEEDLEDILDILGQGKFDPTHFFDPLKNTTFIPENNDQQCPVLQPGSLEELHLFDDSSTLEIFPSLQKVQTQQVAEIHNMSSPGITVHSNCLDFPKTQSREINEIDSGYFTGNVPNSIYLNSNFTGNIHQLIDLSLAASVNAPYGLDHSMSGTETNSLEVSFGSDQGQYPPAKRNLTAPKPSQPKLFGVLSLILQAFNSPLTAEREEFCTDVLWRALAEIQASLSV